MRVLVFHGYLLRGTGSNVYNAELAAALVRLGHEVHLVCQERHPEDFEFVGAVGDWDTGKLVVRRVGDAACTVYRPDIGGLLPVYVADRYEGLEARAFPELTDAELDAYLEANVSAVEEVASRSRPDGALANHLVMGPAILARALSSATPYAVVVHGSALEYTVKPYPRFLPYAHEGVAGAQTVLVGSSPVAHSLWEALNDPALPKRTRIGTPGVDVHTFRPRERRAATRNLRELADRIAYQVQAAPASGEPGSTFDRDTVSTSGALAKLVTARESGPVVAFVGKLIVAKGIDLLVASWPLVLEAVPEATLAVIGFGAYDGAVERWIDALATGDLDAIRELAKFGREAEGGPATRLEFILDFLDLLESSGERDHYLAAAAGIRERVILTGRLEHPELAEVLPLCDALVVPSTFPEAFGMVAVEAAACGALPISARHSGLQEVSETLARDLPQPARSLVSFPLDPSVVRTIAARVIEWLKASADLRDATRAALVQAVREHYSWEGVARGVIAAIRGELRTLDAPSPPAGGRAH